MVNHSNNFCLLMPRMIMAPSSLNTARGGRAGGMDCILVGKERSVGFWRRYDRIDTLSGQRQMRLQGRL